MANEKAIRLERGEDGQLYKIVMKEDRVLVENVEEARIFYDKLITEYETLENQREEIADKLEELTEKLKFFGNVFDEVEDIVEEETEEDQEE